MKYLNVAEYDDINLYVEKKSKKQRLDEYTQIKTLVFHECWYQLMFILLASLEYFIFAVIYLSSI